MRTRGYRRAAAPAGVVAQRPRAPAAAAYAWCAETAEAARCEVSRRGDQFSFKVMVCLSRSRSYPHPIPLDFKVNKGQKSVQVAMRPNLIDISRGRPVAIEDPVCEIGTDQVITPGDLVTVTFVIIACVEKWQDPIAKVSIRWMPRVVALIAKEEHHSGL